jgi:hypothetical protein
VDRSHCAFQEIAAEYEPHLMDAFQPSLLDLSIPALFELAIHALLSLLEVAALYLVRTVSSKALTIAFPFLLHREKYLLPEHQRYWLVHVNLLLPLLQVV